MRRCLTRFWRGEFMKKAKKPLEFYLITVLFSILILVCFLQVLFRFVLNLPLAWTEELSRYVFILMVYLGASAAALEGKHVRVELIDSILPAKVARFVSVVVQMLCSSISLVIAVNIKGMIINSYKSHQLSAALRLPMTAMYTMVSVMFCIIAIRFIQCAWKLSKKGGEPEQ